MAERKKSGPPRQDRSQLFWETIKPWIDEGLSYAEIGRRLNYSREWVRQIRNEFLDLPGKRSLEQVNIDRSVRAAMELGDTTAMAIHRRTGHDRAAIGKALERLEGGNGRK